MLPLAKKPKLEGGTYLSWDIELPSAVIPQIIGAKSLGAGLSPGGGIFSGFKGISTRSGQDKLNRFVNDCVHSPQAVPTPASVPSTPTTLSGPSDIEISRRVAHNFDVRYKKAGMAGLQLSVEACYNSVMKSHKITSLEYCSLLDRMAGSMDSAAAKKYSWTRNPFFLEEKVTQRTSSTFAIIRNDSAANEREMSRWQPLLIFVLNELDAAGKK